ncbi:hypothetical protein ACFL35_01425 [Candidatus Riflebacteria bacterium]
MKSQSRKPGECGLFDNLIRQLMADLLWLFLYISFLFVFSYLIPVDNEKGWLLGTDEGLVVFAIFLFITRFGTVWLFDA